jgi:glyoxalase/bleomycin resistance protein/dioxygenase superfamily protein
MAVPAPAPLTQVGVVVRDIWASMKLYHELLGWAPWYVYEYRPPWFHGAELRGEPVEYSMYTAEVQVGPVWFELVQPLDGPSIYKEFLETKGEGLHHVLVGWDPEEQAPGAATQPEGELPGSVRTARDIRARFEAAGYTVLMGGKLGASTEFYYLDTEPVLKVIVELAGGSPADLEPIATYPS